MSIVRAISAGFRRLQTCNGAVSYLLGAWKQNATFQLWIQSKLIFNLKGNSSGGSASVGTMYDADAPDDSRAGILAAQADFSGNPSTMNTGEPKEQDHSPETWTLVFLAWLIASASTLGALFLSQVMDIAPCVLCWYQRIFMFPLVFILAAGLFPFDARLLRYALPLTAVGWMIALFHVLLVAGVVPENIRPCAQGIPCKDQQIEWFGFLTIPLLSLIAFSLIGSLLISTHFKASK